MPTKEDFLKLTIDELQNLYNKLFEQWILTFEKKLSIIDRILEIKNA